MKAGLLLPLVLLVCAAPAGAAESKYATLSLANTVDVLRPMGAPKQLPIRVEPFIEHVIQTLGGEPVTGIQSLSVDASGALVATTVTGTRRFQDGAWSTIASTAPVMVPPGMTCYAKTRAKTWYGSAQGLYSVQEPGQPPTRHEHYGVDGPLASRVTALAADSKGTLWVGTPLGLSAHEADGGWRHVRGREGVPVEDVTALAVDSQDNLWIGTSRGAALYKPRAEGRQWFYRAGPRYLPNDHVMAVACGPDGAPYFVTQTGVSRLVFAKTTLLQRARAIEQRVNERHRRFGLVADCVLNDAENPTEHTIGDNDNDGLWTAYHVAAMSLCYGATSDAAAKASAKESMHALYMLQDASGTPGLVARSVVTAEEGKRKSSQWRPTPDGTLYWKSDTSADEIDGHYLAFYTYWEHIAKEDPAERDRCVMQVREVTDYIVDNNYQLIDWTGKRTRWGFWNPEMLNGDPEHYVENGLNALQILSFLKVAHYITGDAKYDAHYSKLILEHGYMSNVLLSKKLFPDEHNHSDDQLGFVAWYPILQLERDPKLRAALHAGVRRHYLVVAPEHPSFYIFAYGTIDPTHADLEAGVRNLREIPTDRRTWRMMNSHRADVRFHQTLDRFGRKQLDHVLPADERNFEKWNANPYMPDGGGDGRHEDDGAAYLLPYWMARYHGFLAE